MSEHKAVKVTSCRICKGSQVELDRDLPLLGTNDRVCYYICKQCGTLMCENLEPPVAYDSGDAKSYSAPSHIRHYIEVGAGVGFMCVALSTLQEGLQAKGEKPKLRYCDIGCGFGFTVHVAQKSLGWDAIGLEPSNAGKYGRELLGITVLHEYLEQSDLPPGSFDAILSSEVIEHVPDPDGFCSILAKYLQEDGVVCLTTPNADVIRGCHPIEGEWAECYSYGWHLNIFSPRSIETVLRRNGFADIRVLERDGTSGRKRIIVLAAKRSGILPENLSIVQIDRRAARIESNYEETVAGELAQANRKDSLYWGMAYRMVDRMVSAGNYAKARPWIEEIDAELKRRGNTYEMLMHTQAKSIEELAAQVPFFAGRFLYHQGMVLLNDQADYASAANAFAASHHLTSIDEDLLGGTFKAFSSRALFHSGIARLHMGDVQAALEISESLLSGPELPADIRYRTQLLRGVARQRLGDNTEAMQCFIRAIPAKEDMAACGGMIILDIFKDFAETFSAEWQKRGGTEKDAKRALAQAADATGSAMPPATVDTRLKARLRRALIPFVGSVSEDEVSQPGDMLKSVDPQKLQQVLRGSPNSLAAVSHLIDSPQSISWMLSELDDRMRQALASTNAMAAAAQSIALSVSQIVRLITLPGRAVRKVFRKTKSLAHRCRNTLQAMFLPRTSPSRDILIITPDRLGAMRVGVGMRHWEIAQALSDRGLKVTLASSQEVTGDLAQGDFPVVGLDGKSGGAIRLARDHSCIMVQGNILKEHPLRWMKLRGKKIIVDMVTPFHIENIQFSNKEYKRSLSIILDSLRKGDAFICANERQRIYWLGVLTAMRRLCKEARDANAEFRTIMDVVGFGVPEQPPVKTKPVLKGVHPNIGTEDFLLIWFGGIWNWLNPLPLVKAVHLAHQSNPRIKLFFSMYRKPGEEPQEMAVKTRQLAESLGAADRSVFFNELPVPYAERGDYLLESDLGVVIQAANFETQVSARTRALDYIWAGLPLFINDGDEVSSLVRKEGLGLVTESADADCMAEALLRYADDKNLQEQAKGNLAGIRNQFLWSRMVNPLYQYVVQNRHSTDRARGQVSGKQP